MSFIGIEQVAAASQLQGILNETYYLNPFQSGYQLSFKTEASFVALPRTRWSSAFWLGREGEEWGRESVG